MAQTLNTPFMKPGGHNFIPGTFLGLINETAQDRGIDAEIDGDVAVREDHGDGTGALAQP